jgi:hypothetical protein
MSAGPALSLAAELIRWKTRPRASEDPVCAEAHLAATFKIAHIAPLAGYCISRSWCTSSAVIDDGLAPKRAIT